MMASKEFRWALVLFFVVAFEARADQVAGVNDRGWLQISQMIGGKTMKVYQRVFEFYGDFPSAQRIAGAPRDVKERYVVLDVNCGTGGRTYGAFTLVAPHQVNVFAPIGTGLDTSCTVITSDGFECTFQSSYSPGKGQKCSNFRPAGQTTAPPANVQF